MMTKEDLIDKIKDIQTIVIDIPDQCLECNAVDHNTRRLLGDLEALIDNILVDWKIEQRSKNG